MAPSAIVGGVSVFHRSSFSETSFEELSWQFQGESAVVSLGGSRWSGLNWWNWPHHDEYAASRRVVTLRVAPSTIRTALSTPRLSLTYTLRASPTTTRTALSTPRLQQAYSLMPANATAAPVLSSVRIQLRQFAKVRGLMRSVVSSAPPIMLVRTKRTEKD